MLKIEFILCQDKNIRICSITPNSIVILIGTIINQWYNNYPKNLYVPYPIQLEKKKIEKHGLLPNLGTKLDCRGLFRYHMFLPKVHFVSLWLSQVPTTSHFINS